MSVAQRSPTVSRPRCSAVVTRSCLSVRPAARARCSSSAPGHSSSFHRSSPASSRPFSSPASSSDTFVKQRTNATSSPLRGSSRSSARGLGRVARSRSSSSRQVSRKSATASVLGRPSASAKSTQRSSFVVMPFFCAATHSWCLSASAMASQCSCSTTPGHSFRSCSKCNASSVSSMSSLPYTWSTNVWICGRCASSGATSYTAFQNASRDTRSHLSTIACVCTCSSSLSCLLFFSPFVSPLPIISATTVDSADASIRSRSLFRNASLSSPSSFCFFFFFFFVDAPFVFWSSSSSSSAFCCSP
mmetsp:Transcript_28247/g.86573  ORF Transcript_28247/g.86573 Transcript_28247/m.86573 type:complete len:303 (+) Transcript_28247:1264-2172(+)